METNIIAINTFTLPAVENAITKLDTDLTEDIALDAKHKAQRETEMTYAEFKVSVVDPTESKCQDTINFVRQQGMAWAHLVNTKEFEQQTAKECEQLQIQCNEKERKLYPLEKQKHLLIHGSLKNKKGWLFMPIAFTVGLADGTLAYFSFRHSYSTSMAFITAGAIAVIISCTHFAYAPWIKQTKNAIQRWCKIGAVSAVGFGFFYWIANLRVQAMNNIINLDPLSTNQTMAATLSHWAVCIISFVLFGCVVALSLTFWKSKDQRLKEQEYKKVCAEIAKLTSEMQALKTKNEELQEKVRAQKNAIRLLYNYLKESIRRIKTIGDKACKEFKRVYAQFRIRIPDFFVDNADLFFDEDLDLFEPQNH
jgi:hypothetical protein